MRFEAFVRAVIGNPRLVFTFFSMEFAETKWNNWCVFRCEPNQFNGIMRLMNNFNLHACSMNLALFLADTLFALILQRTQQMITCFLLQIVKVFSTVQLYRITCELTVVLTVCMVI